MPVPGPLSHIRVLDLSRILAGPFAGQVLADLGADVIKVEHPERGDDTRGWGPPFAQGPDGERGDAAYFFAANRGKRSVRADITTSEGQQLVRALAARSDVVLENYKVGGLAKYGLDYDGLRQVKPDLIYCSITGFGQDGPRAHQAAYDYMIQAMGGLMSITGEADGHPGAGPQKVGVAVVDLLSGLYASTAILAALARRTQTGEGDHIDIALLDVMVGSLANQAANYLVSGKAPTRGGNRHPNIQPQDVFPCRQGHIVIAVGNDGQFRKLCAAIARPELADDALFATNDARVANRDALRAALVDALAREDVATWVDRFAAAGVPSAPINSIADALADPQIAHRGMVIEMDHPQRGMVPMIGSPIRFRHATLDYRRAPPLLGEHDAEVRAELDK
jgi:crotonobetainyl-CoA:carnitine CoA-transferase CaiB-like acyl-CoA transferase